MDGVRYFRVRVLVDGAPERYYRAASPQQAEARLRKFLRRVEREDEANWAHWSADDPVEAVEITETEYRAAF